MTHTSYLSQTPQTCLCKNFLSGVNFSRLSEKKCIYLTFSETFLVFLVPRFLGVKFGFRKSCQCKRNDKYEPGFIFTKNPLEQRVILLPVFVRDLAILGMICISQPNRRQINVIPVRKLLFEMSWFHMGIAKTALDPAPSVKRAKVEKKGPQTILASPYTPGQRGKKMP